MALSPPNSSVGDPVTESRQGWHSDGLGRFEQRYYLDGQPTYLVRDGEVERFDDPVPAPNPMVSIPVLPIGTYSRRLDPIVIAEAELEAPTPPVAEAPVNDDGAWPAIPRRPCRRLRPSSGDISARVRAAREFLTVASAAHLSIADLRGAAGIRRITGRGQELWSGRPSAAVGAGTAKCI